MRRTVWATPAREEQFDRWQTTARGRDGAICRPPSGAETAAWICGFGRSWLLEGMRGVKKADLPTKVCPSCHRPFSWRKKWARCWDEVRFCSDACRRGTPRGKAQKSPGSPG
ncbi:MAG: DUF2256 domain-containing protein [Opitutales bacterium]